MAAKIQKNGLPYVIVRSETAGCFAGELESEADEGGGRSVTLRACRRLWYWYGAASLSQLAVDGTSKPKQCKFPAETDRHRVLKVIEVISVTDKAKESIKSVPVWKE